MRKPNFPDRAIRVTTYAELAGIVAGFAKGHLTFLMLLGPPGVGKSKIVQSTVGNSAVFLAGNASPFGIFSAAYQHRGQPLILDDIDGIYRDRQGVRLLKALGQSDQEKKLCWHSDARALASRGLPNEFTTTSPVAIIGNEWCSANPDVVALQDRAHCVVFEPSAIEVHWYASHFFWDQEIFDFVGEHLHLAQPHSLRTYCLAWESKSAGLDWRRLVLSRFVSGNLLVVARLKAHLTYRSEEQRAQAFVAGEHGCRSSYFSLAKKLKNSEPAPTISVCGALPAVTPEAQPILDIT